MTGFVVGKSRNPIVQAAFAGLAKEQRAEKKAKPAAPPAPSKTAKPPRAKVGKPSRKKA